MGFKTKSNKRTNKETHRYRQQNDCYQRGRGERVKGVKHMVMHGGSAAGGEHTVEDTDVVLQSGTLEIYVTSVTPIYLIIKN